MNCNCKWCTTIIGIVILVFAFLEGVTGLNMWIIVIAAILLIIHAFKCKNCGICAPEMATKPDKKRRK